jgi:hypothetical protein
MTYQPDIIIEDENGKAIALVEVKGSRRMNADLAAEYFRRFRDSGALRGIRFFLLVSLHGLYLWDQEGKKIPHDLANREAIVQALPAFLAKLAAKSPDGYSLELAVMQWLLDFAAKEEQHQDPAERTMKEVGLLSAIQQGSVRIVHPA